MLTRRVIIESEPALADRAFLPEKAEIVRRHAVLVQEARHSTAQLSSQGEIEREMLECIFASGVRLRLDSRRVKVLHRFALNEDRVRTLAQNRLDGQLMRHAEISNRARERLLARERLVPKSAQSR